MGTPNNVEYLGDSLFDIDGATLDIDDIAENIVGSQDGDTIDRLIRENSDHSCEYHGDDRWVFDEWDKCDAYEIAAYLSAVLRDMETFPLTIIVENYYTV